MTLIKLTTDSAGKILSQAWANPSQRKAGDVTADGFTVYDLADEEIAKIVPGHSTLADGKVTVDADYTPEPDLVEAEPTPTADQQTIALLTKQVANAIQTAQTAQTAVAALTKQLAAVPAQPAAEEAN